MSRTRGLFWPRALCEGDCVGLFAASSGVPHGVLDAAVAALEAFGLRVAIGESCYAEAAYLAGADALRARDVNRMFADPAIAGLFALRGGYGAQRILPLLDWRMIRRHPKPLFGYSDVTALHTAIQRLCGFITYHTPMPATELCGGLDVYSRDWYEKCLFGGAFGRVENPRGQTLEMVCGGVCTGILTGGNLTLLASSLGTLYALDPRGKILLLEDVDEEPYRIDRMLTQLRLAGVFDECAGILLGAFTRCGEAERVLHDAFWRCGKPVLGGLVCGHCLPTMSLPLGALVRLRADKKEVVVMGKVQKW